MIEETKPAVEAKDKNVNSESCVVTAPILGTVSRINVKVGDTVKVGDELLVLEVMKMENAIKATVTGRVEDIFVEKGTQVSAGQKLLQIK